MTDKDALLVALTKLAEDYDPAPEGNLLTANEAIIDFLHDDEVAARITAALAGESGGWIPVGERLPEKNTDCLVFLGWVDIGTYEPPHKTRSPSESWFSEPAGVHPMFNVTYWRSLPPPPKGE